LCLVRVKFLIGIRSADIFAARAVSRFTEEGTHAQAEAQAKVESQADPPQKHQGSPQRPAEELHGPTLDRCRATAFFDDEMWQDVPASIKDDFDASVLRSLLGEAVKALREGLFNRRPDRHIAWMPVVLDKKGWKEAMKLLQRPCSSCSRSSDAAANA